MNILTMTNQKLLEGFYLLLLFASIGFFVGVSSTPIYKNPPIRKDKYKVLSIGLLLNTLLTPYLGTLISPEASYVMLLPVGTFS